MFFCIWVFIFFRLVDGFWIIFSGPLYFTNTFPRAASAEEASGGANRYMGEERDRVITLDDVSVPSAENKTLSENGATEVPKQGLPAEENQTESLEFLDQLNIKVPFNIL